MERKGLSHYASRLTAVIKSMPVINPSRYRSDRDGFMYFVDGDGHNTFQWKPSHSEIWAYENCPPVSAIINKKTKMFSNGRWWVMDKKAKEAGGGAAKKIRRLFENPNPVQDEIQFRAQMYMYIQLFGWTALLINKPTGWGNIDADSIWNISPEMIDIEETGKMWEAKGREDLIKSVVLNYKGEKATVSIDDIYFITDMVYDLRHAWMPDSRLRPLSQVIKNIVGAYESRGQLIDFRGARGILSSEGRDEIGHIPLTAEEREDIETQFKGRYGLKRGMTQFIITSAAVKWQNIGQSVKELGLFEEVQAGKNDLCDAYDFPGVLLANPKGTTYSNQDRAKRDAYQDAIIPEARSIASQLNKIFQLSRYEIGLDVDYSHVPVLQQDLRNLSAARYTLTRAVIEQYRFGFIHKNRAREILEEDTVPGDDVFFSGAEEPEAGNDSIVNQENDQSDDIN